MKECGYQGCLVLVDRRKATWSWWDSENGLTQMRFRYGKAEHIARSPKGYSPTENNDCRVHMPKSMMENDQMF